MTKGIIGAIIGDIVGSSREMKPVSREGFKLFTKLSTITDDTVLTAAVAEWMLDRKRVSIDQSLRKWATNYPHAGYGSSFKRFCRSAPGTSLTSIHNGAVMRVSSVGFLATSIEECMALARESAAPSHNSKEAIEAAQATAVAIFLARNGATKEAIRDHIESHFNYDLSRPYNTIREELRVARTDRSSINREANHERVVGAYTSVQDALIAFLCGESYEDVIRKAIYLGGDADTEAAIAGGIAAAYYGVPDEIVEQALIYIPSDILEIVNRVDGTSWRASKQIPPKSSRWSKNDIIIYASDEYDTKGESSYYLTHPSRFQRHYNEGYALAILGDTPVSLEEQVELLRYKCEDGKHLRWHLHDIGIESGMLTTEEFRELFAWALELDNVLVTPTLLNR